MIEIDDRIVMLLFILFLGYMLFNQREGFNVGGEAEDSSTTGTCKCKYKYTGGDLKCINETAVNGKYSDKLMEFWSGNCTNIKDKDSCSDLKVNDQLACKWDESEYKFSKGICECKDLDDNGSCNVGAAVGLGPNQPAMWADSTNCTDITNPSECYAKSNFLGIGDGDNNPLASYTVSNYCKWNDNPTVTCDCKNVSGTDCISSKSTRKTSRKDCTSQTTFKGCTYMESNDHSSRGINERMCKVTQAPPPTPCDCIKTTDDNKCYDADNKKSYDRIDCTYQPNESDCKNTGFCKWNA